MIFEDLLAWQQARCLVNSIYALTRRGELAKDFRLCGQLQAAAVSIMSNIAEGFERTHLQEKIQFYNVARGSTGEVRSLLYVVEDNFSELVVHAKTIARRSGRDLEADHPSAPIDRQRRGRADDNLNDSWKR